MLSLLAMKVALDELQSIPLASVVATSISLDMSMLALAREDFPARESAVAVLSDPLRTPSREGTSEEAGHEMAAPATRALGKTVSLAAWYALQARWMEIVASH